MGSFEPTRVAANNCYKFRHEKTASQWVFRQHKRNNEDGYSDRDVQDIALWANKTLEECVLNNHPECTYTKGKRMETQVVSALQYSNSFNLSVYIFLEFLLWTRRRMHAIRIWMGDGKSQIQRRTLLWCNFGPRTTRSVHHSCAKTATRFLSASNWSVSN